MPCFVEPAEHPHGDRPGRRDGRADRPEGPAGADAARPERSAGERARVLPRRAPAGHAAKTGTSRSGTSRREPWCARSATPTRSGGSRQPRRQVSAVQTQARESQDSRVQVLDRWGGRGSRGPSATGTAASSSARTVTAWRRWDAASRADDRGVGRALRQTAVQPTDRRPRHRSPSPPTAGLGPGPPTERSCGGTSATASRSEHRFRSPPLRSSRSRSRPTVTCSPPARPADAGPVGSAGPQAPGQVLPDAPGAGSRRALRPRRGHHPRLLREWREMADGLAYMAALRVPGGRSRPHAGGVERRPARSGLPAHLLALSSATARQDK